MPMTKWIPTTDLMILRRMGKLSEELGELTVVSQRCIIQGIDEVDPGSGEVNRLRLEKEIADVLAQCAVTIRMFRLDATMIQKRQADKESQMAEWESLFEEDSPETIADSIKPFDGTYPVEGGKIAKIKEGSGV